MRVLSFSTDWGVLSEDSAVARRQRMQASTVERLEVFVPHGPKRTVQLAPNATMRGFGHGRLFGALRAILAALRLPQPDVVTTQDPFLIGVVGWLVSRVVGARFHVQVHTDIFSPQFAAHSRKNRLFVYLARFILRRADAVRVVSERIRRSLEPLHLGVPVSVLPVFVDAQAVRTAATFDRRREFPQFQKLVLIVARLEPEKQVDAAIRAFNVVRETHKDAGLVVVGDGSERERLKALARSLGLGESIVFTGARDPYPFYKVADVVFSTSAYEGYGMTIVEALAAGTPVISYDVGVAREAGAIIATPEEFAARAIAVLSEGRRGTLALHLPSEGEYRDMWRAEIGNALAGTPVGKQRTHTPTARIGFIGQGWIGKNYADDFERRGYRVIRYALEEPYRANRDNIRECDIVFIAVPTPTTPEMFDDSHVRSALSLVGEGKVAVVKSTLLPGITEALQKDFPHITVMHSPEFLREATAAYDAAHPDRTVIGIVHDSPDVRAKAADVLAVLPSAPFSLVCSAREAEFVKYAGNVWLYLKVVYVNMLYDLLARLGGRWEVVRDALAADPRIGRSHLDPIHQSGHGGRPGRGAGGHCFIKDFEALRRLYEKEVPDEHGASVLDAVAAKNISLLLASGKDIDLLKGVYGERLEEVLKRLARHTR